MSLKLVDIVQFVFLLYNFRPSFFVSCLAVYDDRQMSVMGLDTYSYSKPVLKVSNCSFAFHYMVSSAQRNLGNKADELMIAPEVYICPVRMF